MDVGKDGELHGDARIMENIDDVKDVALSCEKKIKEFKVSTYIISIFQQPHSL